MGLCGWIIWNVKKTATRFKFLTKHFFFSFMVLLKGKTIEGFPFSAVFHQPFGGYSGQDPCLQQLQTLMKVAKTVLQDGMLPGPRRHHQQTLITQNPAVITFHVAETFSAPRSNDALRERALLAHFITFNQKLYSLLYQAHWLGRGLTQVRNRTPRWLPFSVPVNFTFLILR